MLCRRAPEHSRRSSQKGLSRRPSGKVGCSRSWRRGLQLCSPRQAKRRTRLRDTGLRCSQAGRRKPSPRAWPVRASDARASAPARPFNPSCQRPQPAGLTASDARRPRPPSCTFLLFAPPAVYPDATSAPVRPLPRCGGQGASAWSHPLPGPPLGRARKPAADKPMSQRGPARHASDARIGADRRTP